jgi:mono/diheme cytochrome c family protein
MPGASAPGKPISIPGPLAMHAFASRTKFLLAAILVVAAPVAAFSFQPPAGTTTKAAPAATADSLATGDPAALDSYPVTEFMDVSLLQGADVTRGQEVFNRVGICLSCHGWNGDGMGKNPRSEGEAAKLRESQLDTQSFLDIISCGIPGTPMPYHNSQAYKKPEVCFDQVMADFEAADAPRKGKSIRPADLINLVAYIQTHIQGRGETTLPQCQEYFGASASKTCTNLE